MIVNPFWDTFFIPGVRYLRCSTLIFNIQNTTVESTFHFTTPEHMIVGSTIHFVIPEGELGQISLKKVMRDGSQEWE